MDIRNDQVVQRLTYSPAGTNTSKESSYHGESASEAKDTVKEYTSREIGKAVDDLNKLMESNQTHLKFQMHDKLKEYYVEVINDSTNEVIKQIPSKKLMDVAAKIQEMVGILVDEKM